MLLAILHGSIDQRCVLGLLGSREDQGGVGGGILGLVFANGSKVTRVADDSLQGVFVSVVSFVVVIITMMASFKNLQPALTLRSCGGASSVVMVG